jgi:hypothetical protein
VEKIYLKAKYLASQNNFAEALKVLDGISEQNKSPKYFLLRGKIQSNLEQFVEATSSFERINNNEIEWKEAQTALRRIRKLNSSKLLLWQYKYLNKGSYAIPALLCLFVLLTAVFAAMYLADKNDPQLKENVRNISVLSAKISDNISLLNGTIERTDRERESELKHINDYLIGLNMKLERKLDSIQNVQTNNTETLKVLLMQNEQKIGEMAILLEEFKSLSSANKKNE